MAPMMYFIRDAGDVSKTCDIRVFFFQDSNLIYILLLEEFRLDSSLTHTRTHTCIIVHVLYLWKLKWRPIHLCFM